MADVNERRATNKEQEKKSNGAANQNRDSNPRIQDEDYKKNSASKSESANDSVNMEAIVTADDVVRAGGFGARDDIGSFLPVAADSTDFEASLLEAQSFEETQEEKKRPGLGWTKEMEN
ncbi:uncharacterized protein LOC110032629 [Phalaenopsis equestris]|uniref:uncharacterized protein LOC110032629 n=1 Tax=Phalaenopsis equestris TaxID=78828 RepID=UPI0009E56F98|nr:uncharacterized protein LOC110032629 [Phalaenopsis equestris]XP_020591985.1 uncharacterized protein LOC110032629 [Phalaenopsis equestris]XP_020591993.1 uncharacterized protein LOC110032629 [Phalaenopsis equestris]